MKTVKCKKCGNEFSSKMRQCPNCNKKRLSAVVGSTIGTIICVLSFCIGLMLLISVFTDNKKFDTFVNNTFGINFIVSLLDNNEPDKESFVPKQIQAGEVFEAGSYFELDNIKFTYDGEEFTIENNSDDRVMIICGVYGKKNDGTYEWIGYPSFYGIDEKQYEKDKKENGWAIKQTTNQVNANETLVAKIQNIGISLYNATEDYPDWDIDKDGYYDIAFTISKQTEGYAATVSSNDKVSDYYKLKVE